VKRHTKHRYSICRIFEHKI